SLRWSPEKQGYELTDKTPAGKGNGTFVTRVDNNGRVVSQEFLRDGTTLLGPNDRINLGSPMGPEMRFVSTQGRDLGDGRMMFDRPDGTIAVRRPDGTTVVQDQLGTRRLEDPQGRVVQTTDIYRQPISYQYGK